MAILDEIVTYVDTKLLTSEIKDYSGALNGLQLQNNGRVDRVVSAVDASLEVILEASRIPNTLLIVHHGLFWQGAQLITGSRFRKMELAIRSNLAIYSSHLPLDIHPEIGNNILLARRSASSHLNPHSTANMGQWP